MNPKEIIRNYNGSDTQMTESSRVGYNLMLTDLPAFTAFDSTLDASFTANFLTAIENAETLVADTAIIDIQVQKTELIQIAMDKAREKYNDVKYFVQKAFKSSLATQNEFGLNDYMKARRSSTQMIQFLDEMHKACVKYQPQLITAGFSAAAITEITTIRTELLTTNTNQEVFKKERPKLTEDRIITLNTCYDYLTQVNAAAQRVYKDDYAKQNQFVYMPSSSTQTSQEFTGDVLANTTKIAGTITYSTNNVFFFRNTGLVPLIFCLSTSAQVEGEAVTIGGGATISKASDELNPNATNILVKNTDATATGSYIVEVED